MKSRFSFCWQIFVWSFIGFIPEVTLTATDILKHFSGTLMLSTFVYFLTLFCFEKRIIELKRKPHLQVGLETNKQTKTLISIYSILKSWIECDVKVTTDTPKNKRIY